MYIISQIYNSLRLPLALPAHPLRQAPCALLARSLRAPCAIRPSKWPLIYTCETPRTACAGSAKGARKEGAGGAQGGRRGCERRAQGVRKEGAGSAQGVYTP